MHVSGTPSNPTTRLLSPSLPYSSRLTFSLAYLFGYLQYSFGGFGPQPQVKECPSYIKRLAQSSRRVKEVKEVKGYSKASTDNKPLWR